MATTAKRVKDARKPKFSSRQHNRCKLCGRPRAYLRKFGVCRLCFRQLALKGEIPGVVKVLLVGLRVRINNLLAVNRSSTMTARKTFPQVLC